MTIGRDNKYITTDKYMVFDNAPSEEHFKADELIADTIAILNRKGYKTYRSCSGHEVRSSFNRIKENQIKNFEPEKNCQIILTKDGYWVRRFLLENDVFIKFYKDYNFQYYPENFQYSNKRLFKSFSYVDDLGNMRTREEIIQEIQMLNNIINEWARSLPIIEKQYEPRLVLNTSASR